MFPAARISEVGNKMPKMKTRKSASKRYKVTGSGKVAYKKMGLRHML